MELLSVSTILWGLLALAIALCAVIALLDYSSPKVVAVPRAAMAAPPKPRAEPRDFKEAGALRLAVGM